MQNYSKRRIFWYLYLNTHFLSHHIADMTTKKYTITQYTRDQAKRLGVTIKHSQNPLKKLDVFDKNCDKIASCGAMGYNDYPTFMKKMGKEIADKHRVQYKRRHEKDRHVVGSPGYYADQLLW